MPYFGYYPNRILTSMEYKSIFWFRRDLRLEDNSALYHALKSGLPVIPIFIFDKQILGHLKSDDKRVPFIHAAIARLKSQLQSMGSDLITFYDFPENVFSKLKETYKLTEVYCNYDYEEYGILRDKTIKDLLTKNGVSFKSFKDQTIFDKNEILKADGTPYTVFTPYSRKWLEKLNDFYVKSYPTEKYYANFSKVEAENLISLKEMNFDESSISFPDNEVADNLIAHYDKNRDIPSINGTSRLGVHLRFGTVSIRKLAQRARHLNATFLNELIWRDFYFAILFHFPHINASKSFKPVYDLIKWRNDENDFEKWKAGKTGYPIVDAGMRELAHTGYMHNRVRMITASFLVKDLLIDWRWGEAWFTEKLLDFDFAANNGGWQWAAGSGCDAAPYFRIFNPDAQQKKFDPDLKYIKKWVPEFGTFNYPLPIVDHKLARERTLQAFKSALGT